MKITERPSERKVKIFEIELPDNFICSTLVLYPLNEAALNFLAETTSQVKGRREEVEIEIRDRQKKIKISLAKRGDIVIVQTTLQRENAKEFILSQSTPIPRGIGKKEIWYPFDEFFSGMNLPWIEVKQKGGGYVD